jgi:hypothetical protein
MPRIPGTVVRHASDKQRIACQSHQDSAQVCVSVAPNAQQQTLRLALRRRAFGELLDQLEDHDHQDDDDQHSNHGVHPRRHCCHLLHGIGVASGSWSLKIRGESVISYPRIGGRNHARLASGASNRNSASSLRRRDESVDKPDSVAAVAGRGDHPSATAVTSGLVRSTRRLGRAALRRLRRRVRVLLILLRVGFTEPSQSPGMLVVSYTAVSPLPPCQ